MLSFLAKYHKQIVISFFVFITVSMAIRIYNIVANMSVGKQPELVDLYMSVLGLFLLFVYHKELQSYKK